MAILEVTGDDIQKLSDVDLRTLCVRLALAEFRSQGLPSSSILAGGNQDAPDGGLDVRIECMTELPQRDFIPRQHTGLQVKKPDMPPGKIEIEMRPAGVLRSVIRELAEVGGAYIIVSAQGSVADGPLRDRRAAMRAQLHDLPEASKLHTDFYDRDRLAIWANEYDGVAAWVRNRVGRGFSSWSSVGEWTGARVSQQHTYLWDDKACITDARNSKREPLTVAQGIVELRAALSIPQQCIRLVGLSGVGKTRLVQALFETDLEGQPLDPSLALYTDYSRETDPPAREMARHLVMHGRRAILLVDNCNSATHSELVSICAAQQSKVSLLTVEYDVGEDQPECTDVFLLQTASPNIVARWLRQSFANVSWIDCETIAEFSDGNFRVARALAETLKKGETLGNLKSRDLLDRIFMQRQENDKALRLAAEDLSLLCSINGEDTTMNGELARLARIRKVDVSVMYETLIELLRRGVAQSRSEWRAILPHAIANPLACRALERMTKEAVDDFLASLSPRMLSSFSRRLGFLHESEKAKSLVSRWLSPAAPYGNLLSPDGTAIHLLVNIAPVDPEATLAVIEQSLNGSEATDLLAMPLPARSQLMRLTKSLAHDSHMFERAVILLSRFFSALDVKTPSTDRELLGQLFQLRQSGTNAAQILRQHVIERWATSRDPNERKCAVVALDALLTTDFFTSQGEFRFGARSRDSGCVPSYEQACEWYAAAVDLIVRLSASFTEATSVLARHVRDIWRLGPCKDALVTAAEAFLATRGEWLEGWAAFRFVLRFDGKGMPHAELLRTEEITERLRPRDLLNQARAAMLYRANDAWDFLDENCDGETVAANVPPGGKAARVAQEIGAELARNDNIRVQFLPEILADSAAPRAFDCGIGLATGATDLPAMWESLVANLLAVEQDIRRPEVLGGFLFAAAKRDDLFADTALDEILETENLGRYLPYFQARIGIDRRGIARLRSGIAQEVISARDFLDIANNVVKDAPSDDFGSLLLDISNLPGGVAVALDVLYPYLWPTNSNEVPWPVSIIDIGRQLLRRGELDSSMQYGSYGLRGVIRSCCVGSEGKDTAQVVCQKVREILESDRVSSIDLYYVFEGLFESQPEIALDTFVQPGAARRTARYFQEGSGQSNPVERMQADTLRQWADLSPEDRYPTLSVALSMFVGEHQAEADTLSPLFLTLLDHAPNKAAFLGEYWEHVHPSTYSGPLSLKLERRRDELLRLGRVQDEAVRSWLNEILPILDRYIRQDRDRSRMSEGRFE